MIALRKVFCFALAAAVITGIGLAPAHGQERSPGGRPLVEVSIGDQIGSEVDYANVWVAEHEGYFTDEGIKLVRKTYSNGPEALLHFANGEVDTMMGGLAPIMQAAARGQDFRIVMSVTKNNAPLVGRKDITGWKQLEGKIVGSPGLGTVQDAILNYVQATEGVKFKRVFAKVSDFALMVDKGEIDAFISWEPAAATAIAQNPKVHYIAQNPPIKNAESLILIAHPSMVKNKPQVVAGLVKATLRGMEFIKKNPPEKVAEIVAKKMNNPGAKPIALNAMGSVIITEPRIDMPSTRIIIKTVADAGKIPASFGNDVDGWINKYIDYSYLDKAEKELVVRK
jgi:NitT/TauT family transport system substrate-binding protein